MEQTPSTPKNLPLIHPADWILMGMIALMGWVGFGMSFLGGLYWEGWILAGFLPVFLAFTLWVTLAFMPIIHPVRERLLLRLTIRVALLMLSFFLWWIPNGLWRPEVPLVMQGSQRAFQQVLSEADFQALRQYVQTQYAARQETLIVDPALRDLPGAFAHLHRPWPPVIEVRPYGSPQKLEAHLYWGSSLTGHHGLTIDPKESPALGAIENDGRMIYHTQFADGVYFFHSTD